MSSGRTRRNMAKDDVYSVQRSTNVIVAKGTEPRNSYEVVYTGSYVDCVDYKESMYRGKGRKSRWNPTYDVYKKTSFEDGEDGDYWWWVGMVGASTAGDAKQLMRERQGEGSYRAQSRRPPRDMDATLRASAIRREMRKFTAAARGLPANLREKLLRHEAFWASKADGKMQFTSDPKGYISDSAILYKAIERDLHRGRYRDFPIDEFHALEVVIGRAKRNTGSSGSPGYYRGGSLRSGSEMRSKTGKQLEVLAKKGNVEALREIARRRKK